MLLRRIFSLLTLSHQLFQRFFHQLGLWQLGLWQQGLWQQGLWQQGQPLDLTWFFSELESSAFGAVSLSESFVGGTGGLAFFRDSPFFGSDFFASFAFVGGAGGCSRRRFLILCFAAPDFAAPDFAAPDFEGSFRHLFLFRRFRWWFIA